MMSHHLRLGLLVSGLLVFGVLNTLVYQKENLLATGQSMLLELAPVDPRSLMQGDYMVLRYALILKLEVEPDLPSEGAVIVRADPDGVAQWVRLDRGEPLAEGERRLNFKRRDAFRLGAESFFFEEGKADHFANARYGELKVTPSGQSLLVGLRDEKRQPL
ncbi:MAG: GDYXXLXY domain-containing protein [Myxococcota bacterium]